MRRLRNIKPPEGAKSSLGRFPTFLRSFTRQNSCLLQWHPDRDGEAAVRLLHLQFSAVAVSEIPENVQPQPVAGGDESNPRITWGKFDPDHRGRLMMPVTLLAHHALVDGLHAAAFYKNIEAELDRLP